MKKTITEVENAIENRIAELEEEYELDIYDRNDIREEEYQKAGWRHDPFPEELEEEDEEEEEDWHYHSMEERLKRGRHEHEGFLLRNPKRLPSRGWGSASYPPFWFGMIHKTAARCLCTLWRRFSLLSLLSRGNIQ